MICVSERDTPGNVVVERDAGGRTGCSLQALTVRACFTVVALGLMAQLAAL